MKNEIPDICADRLDYLLRDMLLLKRIDPKKVDDILSDLSVHNNKLVFTDKETAKYFAEEFIEMNKVFWATPLQVALFKILSDAIRMALSRNVISEADIFLTDNELYKKLEESRDEEITDILDLISNLSVIEDKKEYDIHIKSKVRYADPEILLDGKITRLSEIDNSFKKNMNNFLQEMSKGFFVRIKK